MLKADSSGIYNQNRSSAIAVLDIRITTKEITEEQMLQRLREIQGFQSYCRLPDIKRKAEKNLLYPRNHNAKEFLA